MKRLRQHHSDHDEVWNQRHFYTRSRKDPERLRDGEVEVATSADSNDKDHKEAKRARMVKMRKALRDWKIEKSRIKGINNARRDRKKNGSRARFDSMVKKHTP